MSVLFKAWVTTKLGRPRVVSIRMPRLPDINPSPRDYPAPTPGQQLFFDSISLAYCFAGGFLAGWLIAWLYFS